MGKLGRVDGVRDKFITVFFLMTCSDVPTMLSGIFFLVFYFLKKIDSVSKTLVLNKVIIFYNPLSFFGHDISDFQKLIQIEKYIVRAEMIGQLVSSSSGA